MFPRKNVNSRSEKSIIDGFHKFYYDSEVWDRTYWLGCKAYKCPLDLWIYQEIIYKIKPDIIIETGTARGGNALFLASICDLVKHGEVLTIDIKKKKRMPRHKRIKYLIGSSISGRIVKKIKRLTRGKNRVMAILDSDHHKEHVLQELRIYSKFVTKGSYLIVEDTNINGHPVYPNFGPGPMEAVNEFLKRTEDFVVDRTKEKFYLTCNPKGYLQRKTQRNNGNMKFKRILIVKLSSIGDVVHALPALSALRKRFPESYIAWVVKKKAADIIIGHPHLDEIIIYEGIRKTAKKLRSLKFDLAIDLQGLFRSGFLTFSSGAKVRLGFSRANSRELSYLFLNQRVTPGEKDRHVIDKNLSLLRPLGIEVVEKEFIIPVSNANREYVTNFLKKERVTSSDILIALNSRASWPSKLWPEERWAELADRLIEGLKAKIVLLWGAGEKDLVDRIVRITKNKPIISCRTNLKELAVLISKCKLFVGGETGPLHIACALNIPTIALIGPTESVRNGPYGEGHIVIEKNLPCRGCWKYKCKRLDCMKLITVDEVFSAVKTRIIANIRKTRINTNKNE